MNNKYEINIVCVVLGIDMAQNKQFVLSLSRDEIEFINFGCNKDFLKNKEQYLTEYLKNYIFVNDIELLSQIITIDTKYISDNSDTISVIYGFVTNKTPSISNKCYWVEFNYQEPNPYSNILFEVTQKLK